MRRRWEHTHSNPIIDTFNFVADTQRQVRDITSRAKEMVKKHYQNPDDLALFIESQGTPVFLLRGGINGFAVRLALFFFGFDPGFIPPPDPGDAASKKRYEALLQMVHTFLHVRPTDRFDKGMFVLPKPMFTVGYVAHQMHHWLSCLAGLPGYNAVEQEEFRKFMVEHNGIVGPEVEKMTETQIASLRHAIHREIEALKFIKEVTEEIFRPLRQSKNITQGSANA